MKQGRPTKLNEEVQNKIVQAVQAGNYIETAAAYAGINKSSFYEWLKRGEREKQRVEKDSRLRVRKSEEDYVSFSNAIEKALAVSEMRDVLIIGKAAETQWQAAAWRLERKFPKRWGKKEFNQTELTGKDGGAIEITDARKRLIEKLSKGTDTGTDIEDN